MNRKSKWQEHINVYTNFLTPYNFSCYLLMLSKSHYLIALSYTWYATHKIMQHVDSLGKYYYAPIKANRNVSKTSASEPCRSQDLILQTL